MRSPSSSPTVDRARKAAAAREKAEQEALEEKRLKALEIAREEKAKKREMQRQMETEKAAARETATAEAERVAARPQVAAHLVAKVPKILAGEQRLDEADEIYVIPKDCV